MRLALRQISETCCDNNSCHPSVVAEEVRGKDQTMGFYETFMELTEDDALPRQAAMYPEPEEGTLDHLSHLFIQDPGGVDTAFDQIEQTVNSDPYLALTQCSLISGVITTAASKALNLTKRLSNAISRLQTIVAGIVQKVNATSFTITVGFPVSVSIGVTWS
jgi:hypothetical protein